MARLTGELLALEKRYSSVHITCQTALLISLTLAFCHSEEAIAGDFSHAKQVYVPPSRIIRRVDFASMREEGTATPPATPSYASAKPKASAPKTARITKTGSAIKHTASASSTRKPTTAGAPLPPPLSSSSSLLSSVRSKMDPALAAKMESTARQLIKSGRLDEAQRLLEKLSQSPEDQALLKEVSGLSVDRARELLKQGNLHEALLSTRQTLRADPSNSAAQGLLNQIHKQNGLDPTNLQDRIQAANKLYSLGHYQEAEVEYRATLAIKPTAEAQIGLSKVAARLRGYLAAKQELEKALELDSNSSAVRRELGLLHLNQGDVVGANSELSRALILDPKDNVSGTALISLWQGQVSKLPNANSHLGLARAYQLNGDLPSAQAAYRQVVRLDPNHPYLPAARQSFKLALARQEADKSIRAARTLDSQGLTQEAFKRAQQAVSLSPGDTGFRIYQGELLEKMGLPTQAREAYLNILKDDPQNVLAAQKIRNLPINAIPGVPLTRHPDGFPGTKFPLPVDGLAVATAAATGTPGVPIDHVTTLSNFLGSLRSHMNEQKRGMEQFEDLMKKAQQPAAASPDVTEALHTSGGDDLIENILHSPVGSPLPSKGASAVESAATTAPAISPAPSYNFSPKGGTVNASAKRLKDLEEQNRRLQEQLQNLRSGGKAGPSSASTPYTAPGNTTFSAPPSVAPPIIGAAGSTPSANIPPAPGIPQEANGFPLPATMIPAEAATAATQFSPSTLSAMAPAMIPGQSLIPGQSQMPNQSFTNQDYPQPGPTVTLSPSESAAGNSPLRFELKEIQPGLTDVRLKVVLKNESGKTVQLPEHLRAVIKYRDSREAEVHVAFTTRSIPGGGSVDGIVKVPLSKVDPSADLILRNVLPSTAGDPDLHLITSLVHR